jgi:crotonobetainyl-CoA:carnitine CoA-transferase CaiB-like acyl-CoA transferase
METQLNAAQSDPSLQGGWHLSAPTEPPDYPIRTKDPHRWVDISLRDREGWNALGRAMNVPKDKIDDFYLPAPSMSGLRASAAGTAKFFSEFESFFAGRTPEEIRELAQECGGNAAIINDYESLFADSQVAAMRMLREVQHPSLGTIKTLGIPWDFGALPEAEIRPPPALGQHTSEVKSGLLQAT